MDTLLLFAMIVFSSMLTAGLCLVGFMVLRRRVTDDRVAGAETRSERIIDQAHRAAGSIRADAESSAASELQRRRERLEREIVERKEALEREEDRIAKIEEKVAKEQARLERRLHEVEGREREVGRAEKEIQAAEARASALAAEARAKLEAVGGLTAEEARRRLVEAVVDEARREAARRVREIETETKEEAEKRAKRILGIAIQRYAGEYVAERTVSVVALPNDDMKGRIIGREGRNIRAFEAAAGVDLIVDDTPETVVVSCFNPVRRAIAKVALERLIEDGRIHPTRIEEVVAKVTEEIDEEIREAGERAAFDVGVHGLHPEVVKLLGRLKFRTSYTQNVLAHSCEAAHLAGIMAAELGLDSKLAKRAALLHDVGKSLDADQEGSHALVGAEFLRKRGESDAVVNAVAAHHAEVEQLTVYPMLVQAADALSGARPGARREVLESYIQRLEKLEEIANGFPGVTRTYAIQAGREIRVAVDSEVVGDAEAALLSHEIARKIEKELTYPGQIRVTVIRETRAVDVAR